MNDEWDRQKDIDAEGQRAMMVPRKPDLSNVGKATAYKMGYRQAQADLRTPDPRTAALVEAARATLNAFDQGRMVERGAGGMTIEAQIRRSVYNDVPAWPAEELRAALAAWEA